MPNVTKILEGVNGAVKNLPFNLTACLLVGSFLFIFIVALVFCAASPRVRAADKRPFFHFLNFYTALLFAVCTAHFSAAFALVPCALFWIIGYMMYGALCAFKPASRAVKESAPRVAYDFVQPSPAKQLLRQDVPAAKANVRLEHALGITERLLARDAGKSDRSELEKIKSTLCFLQTKGTLTVQENDILNDNFNALLKLMAKYGE